MKQLKILHLLSNWKWTEVSEPAVELALAQQQLGAKIEFVCGRGPADRAKRRVDYHAHKKNLTSIHVLDMPKHLKILSAIRDCAALRPMLRRFKPDVIHCHKKNAQVMGVLSRGVSKRPLIVRACYDSEGPPRDLRSRLMYKVGTDGMVVINERSRQRAVARHGILIETVQVVEPGIDLDRFSPRRHISETRASFGLKQDAFVVGVVTRIRASRRLDIPLKALHALAPSYPQLQMLLVGRGREGAVENVVAKPARTLNIFDRIVLAGYCEEDRLVAAYRAMDLLVYPIPGSDKSCRTVREAMAAGVPVIAPAIGFLPELIEDHSTGRLMALAWESLAKILEELILDRAQLLEMGQRSLQTAIRRFSPVLQAERTLYFYHKLLVNAGYSQNN
ncbi:MAG: glycosyltransferase family 4 protein [Desulfobacteraceae bacterium]|jgi:glycosyltransferase involved in cell wall biosynthesis|nr:glycosyltransferase family 4 protein [Desulfobacteraceae bacterium]